MNYLLQPKKYKSLQSDEGSKAIMKKTIDFFENMGKSRLIEDYWSHLWYKEFIAFLKKERIFYKMLTPKEYADGDPDCRWDTARNCEYSELLAFYGMGYWYCFQVTILGLGPIWMSSNEKAKRKAAALLKDGAIFAFGMSEREHGADLYSTETSLHPDGNGNWLARGEKYYIGNGNEAEMVSIFGKVRDGSDDYCFFVANYHNKAYELKRNIISHQQYVAQFSLNDYPITEDEILSRGSKAWDDALNTVNIGKFNIGPSAIGLCEHSFYESITHAANRVLYGMHVTDMPHVKQNFMDAWLRLVGMKMYQRRAADYFRNGSIDDRRYLLFNPTSKMKVTLQAEQVMALLWEVIAAKGFERDMHFSTAVIDITGPSKLEGTVHINVMLIRKFMKNYFFNPKEFAYIPPDLKPRDDIFVFNQGTAHGLSKVQFNNYRLVFEAFNDLPNVAVFIKQIDLFCELLQKAFPDKLQETDLSFALAMGEMFSIVAYGQLILEQAKIENFDRDILNQIFDFMVRDFAGFALQIYGKHTTYDSQRAFCKEIMEIKAVPAPEQYNKIWEKQVLALNGEYAMNE